MSEPRQLAFGADERFLLYLEGVNCAFSEIEFLILDDQVPALAISLPPTDAVLRIPEDPAHPGIPRRTKVHLLHREFVRDEWVVMCEAEITSRGFSKHPSARDVTFMATHVIGLIDQLAIVALDPASAVAAQLRGLDVSEPIVNNPTADPLSIFTLRHVGAELDLPKPKEGDPEVSFPAWVRGSMDIFGRALDQSRLADSYLNKAFKAHRIRQRLVLPDEDALNWGGLYNKLLAYSITAEAQPRSGRLSYGDLLRTVSGEFLHQVTFAPTAESWTKQIQVRPACYFTAIPRCNVLFPSLTDTWQFLEDVSTRITRLRSLTFPTAGLAEGDAGELAALFTVFAPAELQWKWQAIRRRLASAREGRAASTTTGATAEDTDKLIFVKPKDGIPFTTAEEEAVGINPDYMDVPKTLEFAIASLIDVPKSKEEGLPNPSTTSSTIARDDPARVLRDDGHESRHNKYLAFLSQALGAGDGIDPGQHGLGNFYPRWFDRLLPETNNAPPHPQKPRSITFLGLDVHPKPYNAGSAKRPYRLLMPADKEILSRVKANYFIMQDGTIIELLPRHHFIWEIPDCLPMGIYLKPPARLPNGKPSPWTAERINAAMPPRDFTAAQAAATYIFDGAVNLGSWPPTSTQADFSFLGYHPADFGKPNWPLRNTERGEHSLVFRVSAARTADGKTVKADVFHDLDRNTVAWIDDKEATLKHSDTFLLGADAFVYLHFDRKVVSRDATRVSLRLGSGYRASTLKHPFGPWMLTDGRQTKSRQVPTPVTAGDLDKVNIPLSSKQVICGNAGHLAVALEAGRGQRPSEPQIEAAAFLVACVKELRSLNLVGPKGAYLPNRQNRKCQIADDKILAVEDHFPFTVRGIRVSDAVKRIGERAKVLQDRLYADFRKWNAAYEDGKGFRLAEPVVPPEPPSGLSVADPQLGRSDITLAAGQTHGEQALEEAMVGLLTLEDLKYIPSLELDELKAFFAGYTNYQFYNRRFASQGFEAHMAFNPYLLPGYPCLLLDASIARYHLVAYLRGVKHIIHSNEAWTIPILSHVRAVRHDPLLLPFVNKTKQGWGILKEAGVDPPPPVWSFLPVELLSVPSSDHSASGTRPSPLVFDGGFGLGKLQKGNTYRDQDFSRLAVFCGYTNENPQTAPKLPKAHFLFADDPVFKEKTSLVDRDSDQAYRYNYRPISRVGQNDVAKSQASLVKFSNGSKFPIRQGAKSDDVKAIQKALLSFGFELKHGADGKFGPETLAAVQAFQRQHAQTVAKGKDRLGQVGQATWDALGIIETNPYPKIEVTGIAFETGVQNLISEHTATCLASRAVEG